MPPVPFAPAHMTRQATVTIADDDVAAFERWLATGEVARASDDDARGWTARSPRFRCFVAAPWVVVQELGEPDAPPPGAR